MHGTFGTLVGIPLFLALAHLLWPFYLAAILLFATFSIYISGPAEKLFKAKDPSCIVIDEIAGIQFAFLFATPTLWHILLGFLLFRFFDIMKLFPANLCESMLRGGYAVVLDDVVAGIYAALVLWVLIRLTGM